MSTEKVVLTDLRRRAIARLEPVAQDIVENMSSEEINSLILELRTHQIELELQNEDLRLAQRALTTAHDRYRDLYDFAPVGYLTFDRDGVITDANLTLAGMLGVDREKLVDCLFSDFILAEDQDAYYHHRQRKTESSNGSSCQLRVCRTYDDPLWVELEELQITNREGWESHVRMLVVDISVRHQAEEKLSYQAKHDSLTGLINRIEFEQNLSLLLERARRFNEPSALCYIDLDQFKVVNDTCGHAAGDELLRQLSTLLTETTRTEDSVARLGGDEFGLLIAGCNPNDAYRLCSKLRESIADFRFTWDGRIHRVSASIGLVPIDKHSENTTNLMSAADSACYAAKDQGRNRVHVYDINDRELNERRGEMRWISRIEQALEEDRFQLWMQPIVPIRVADSKKRQFEILLRLIDEEGAIQTPGSFLPAAERYGLSTKIDYWVVGAVVQLLSEDTALTQSLERCFINLSGATLTDEGFLDYACDKLKKYPEIAKKLCFEVTETSTIANLSSATKLIVALKEQGCRFALDDFGSGLSSFAYLQVLPVDYLKIDGGFISDMLENTVNQSLVRAINDVGKALGKLTIAEFVENDETRQMLYEFGVDYGQGYGLGRPEPVPSASWEAID